MGHVPILDIYIVEQTAVNESRYKAHMAATRIHTLKNYENECVNKTLMSYGAVICYVLILMYSES